MTVPDRTVPVVRIDERTGLMSALWYDAMLALQEEDTEEAAARAAADSALDARLDTLETAPDVVAPTLLGAWANYGAGYEAAGYMRSADHIVYVRGFITAGVISTSAFQLPVGFRPANTELFAVGSNGTIGLVEVRADGNVVPVVGNNTYVSLSGIAFRATP